MPHHDLTITKADSKDVELLTKLGITAFLEAFAKHNRKEDMDKYIAEEMNMDKITAELNDKDNIFFLSWYDGVLAGYSKMRTVKKPTELNNENPIELERLYVLAKYYNHKIGAALMNYCLTHAVALRYSVMWLGVWEHNLRAVNFYKKWGFEFFGAHQFRLGDDIQTDQLMKKKL